MARSGKYSIILNWLNTIGGWEHWNFQAEKTHGYNISDVQNIERDILNDWDTDFTAGQTQREHISLTARKTKRIRSESLTQQQIEAIARIKLSLKVNDETDVNNIKTVLVDKSSFQYRQDGDKLHFISFEITYPDEQIQSL